MSTNSVLDALNEAQRAAVTSPPQEHCIVLSGAGTGKTRVLTHRFAWLLESQQLHFNQILAATFTNKAAAEMRERIEQLTGQSSNGSWIGTFHSLCRRMLSRFPKEAGLHPAFRIIDHTDQRSMIREILNAANLPHKRADVDSAIKWISGQKSQGRRATHVPVIKPEDKQYIEVMKRFEARCKESDVVDFDDLLLGAVELLREHPNIAHHYQQRIRHILVDEFQDINELQYSWLQLLSGEEIPIFAVGDDDQSIYSWRGAKPDLMFRFKADYSGLKTWRLEQNYRSTTPILECANAIIERNETRLRKTLWTENSAGDPVFVVNHDLSSQEPEVALRQFWAWKRQHGHWSDCALLYRTNQQSRDFESCFMREGVPYRIYGGTRFFERAEIKNALAYLRLCHNPDDDISWARICNIPPRRIGGSTLEQVRQQARKGGTSLAAACRNLIESDGTSRTREALAQFQELLEDLRQRVAGLGLRDAVQRVLSDSKLKAMYEELDLKEEEKRADNLNELVNSAAQFEWQHQPEPGDDRSLLHAYLDTTVLDAGEGGTGADGDAIQMMTLHKAKGLEFPLVFIAGFERGFIPMVRAGSDPEEERRLCYVGMTRASKRLVLSFANERWIYGHRAPSEPSVFLQELPLEHVECNRELVSRLEEPTPRPKRAPTAWGVPEIGTLVSHQTFGQGIITRYEGRPPQLRVMVEFQNAGAKWMMYSYAKLEPIPT